MDLTMIIYDVVWISCSYFTFLSLIYLIYKKGDADIFFYCLVALVMNVGIQYFTLRIPRQYFLDGDVVLQQKFLVSGYWVAKDILTCTTVILFCFIATYRFFKKEFNIFKRSFTYLRGWFSYINSFVRSRLGL